MAKSLIIEFERIGRNHSVPPLRIATNRSTEYVEHEVTRYARKFLASREFWVHVDNVPVHEGETGNVSIDAGRFGNGTIRVEAEEMVGA